MSRLVKLPSGALMDVDRIIFSMKDKKAIGQHALVVADAQGVVPILDQKDFDFLVSEGFVYTSPKKEAATLISK